MMQCGERGVVKSEGQRKGCKLVFVDSYFDVISDTVHVFLFVLGGAGLKSGGGLCGVCCRVFGGVFCWKVPCEVNIISHASKK
ncbi:hypothetical protein E2C01_069624 [Portunus trituberculatus]|uniref:Uncharacterized protein n=1 Tax=Portunus trituberculatus TaxID=210409 RepID=A0A5B7HS21_PORTR|nr:hypothetical protein [Portunus trituberculatus]